MASVKSNLSLLCALGFFLLLSVLFVTPQSMLFFRAGSCGMGWSDAQICNAFLGPDKASRSGYLITRKQRFAGEQTFDIASGKMIRMCGDAIYQTLQNGKYCAEGPDIELYKRNMKKIIEERQRKIREAQDVYSKGLQQNVE